MELEGIWFLECPGVSKADGLGGGCWGMLIFVQKCGCVYWEWEACAA